MSASARLVAGFGAAAGSALARPFRHDWEIVARANEYRSSRVRKKNVAPKIQKIDRSCMLVRERTHRNYARWRYACAFPGSGGPWKPLEGLNGASRSSDQRKLGEHVSDILTADPNENKRLRRHLRWRKTTPEDALAAERALVGLGSIPLRMKDTIVGDSKHDVMHAIIADTTAPADAPVLVSLAGYSAGSGYHFRVIPGLASAFKVHAVDLLGTGLSGRPSFTAHDRKEAEAFFVDALERWRIENGIPTMVLMGHSLGGYLATRYTLRHPESVSHLILVSPAGVGAPPPEWTPKNFPPAWSLRGILFRSAIRGWDAGLTPGGVIRTLGPVGPGLVSKYVRRRFHAGVPLNEAETAAFEKYAYHILAARGSGEYALRHLLAPFAWPREALESAIPSLKVPVTFVYGQSDWMDVRAGRRAAAALSASPDAPDRAFLADREVYTVADAGHYPFIDNPAGFLSAVHVAAQSYLPAAASAALRNSIEDARRAALGAIAKDMSHDATDSHQGPKDAPVSEAARRAAEV